MVVIADIDECIGREFGSRLETEGFRRVGKRKWVRSSAASVRHLFTIGALKGATYCPIWGVSSGVVPVVQGTRFKRQTTEKNAVMDLTIDPIDQSGKVPPESFMFLPGFTTAVPQSDIRECAAHFVPVALEHFDRAQTLAGFIALFRERSLLRYARFGFDMYLRHRLTRGFVCLLEGNDTEGLQLVRDFCQQQGLDQNDQVLLECVAAAKAAA